jgi:ankyrin repeat protein
MNWSPLLAAVKFGQESTTRLLLSLGARPNISNRSGATPLHIAAKYGHNNILNILLETGADLRAFDIKKETPVMAAVKAGNAQAFDRFCSAKGFDPTVLNHDRQSLLHLAAEYGSLDIVSKLLELGLNPNAQDVMGNTPLHYATQNNWTEIIRALLGTRMDVSKRNTDGKSAFSYASVKDAGLFRAYFDGQEPVVPAPPEVEEEQEQENEMEQFKREVRGELDDVKKEMKALREIIEQMRDALMKSPRRNGKN